MQRVCGEAVAPEVVGPGVVTPCPLRCALAVPTLPLPPLQEPVLLPAFPEIITNLVTRNGQRSYNCQLEQLCGGCPPSSYTLGPDCRPSAQLCWTVVRVPPRVSRGVLCCKLELKFVAARTLLPTWGLTLCE